MTQHTSDATNSIAKAAVIGAGSMGSGIAAQFANAGVPVLLLDLAGKDGGADAAAAGIARQLKAGGFMHPDAAALVEPGTIEHDLPKIAGADWIVEAVVEQIEVKRSLYRRIEAARRPGSVVSSNTSTLQLQRLLEGQSPAFRRDFLITHFFNPPRAMRLVELVTGPETGAAAIEKAGRAADLVLGKTAVAARDTPGFIANRIGCAWLAFAAIEAIRGSLTVEEADAVLGAPFGVPRTSVFGLFDLIGIDLVPQVWGSLYDALPASDRLRRYDLRSEPVFQALLERKLFGRKSGSGFYKLNKDKSREVFDFTTLAYRPERRADLPSVAAAGRSLAKLCAADDKAGRLAWRVLSELTVYTAEIAEEIAESPAEVDVAMRLGYSWADGPLALADKVGAAAIAGRLKAEGRTVPALLAAAARAGGFYAPDGSVVTSGGARLRMPDREGVLVLGAGKASRPPVLKTAGASLIDIGEGVACLEFHTKMNILDDSVFEAVEMTVERLTKDFRALVIGNDDPRAFSAGANLGAVEGLIERGDFAALDRFLNRGQAALQALKYAPFPVVAAATGLALGGGCEVLMHCDEIVAHAELSAGLPEVKVGLVPGWGGCTQLLVRFAGKAGAESGPQTVARQAFEVIFSGRASRSALEARDMAVLRPRDLIVMNRDRVLGEARARAAALAAGYKPPEPPKIFAAGPSGRMALKTVIGAEREAGRLSEVDAAIGEVLAGVLTGGPTADPAVPLMEADVMRLEREALTALAATAPTRLRIRHMLETGKPLRN